MNKAMPTHAASASEADLAPSADHATRAAPQQAANAAKAPRASVAATGPWPTKSHCRARCSISRHSKPALKPCCAAWPSSKPPPPARAIYAASAPRSARRAARRTGWWPPRASALSAPSAKRRLSARPEIDRTRHHPSRTNAADRRTRPHLQPSPSTPATRFTWACATATTCFTSTRFRARVVSKCVRA